MAQFINAIFSVTGFGVLAAVGAAWLARRPASAAARRFIVGVVATYVVLSIFVVPYTVGRLLVLGYHPFTAADVPRGRTAIVLLGAGGTTTVDWTGEHYSLLERVGAARVLEAVRVFRMMPDAVIISSGGVGNAEQDTDGVMQRAALLHLGVPAASIVLEDRSQNTRDEAVIIAPMLRQLAATPRRPRHVGLSHATVDGGVPRGRHRRRAGHRARSARQRIVGTWLLPDDNGLDLSRAVVHELLGIPYYAVRGWAGF